MENVKLSKRAIIALAALLLFIVLNIAVSLGAFSLGEWIGGNS